MTNTPPIPANLVRTNVDEGRKKLHMAAYTALLANSALAATVGMEIVAERKPKTTRNKHKPTKAEKKAAKKARQK